MSRERERERGEERDQEHQWTVVSRRKSKPHQPIALRTCFVNHLPLSITISDIAQVFRSHGAIANVSIPTFQKYPTHKFAFVQFYFPQSLATAVRDENGRIIENKAISVFPAKKDMGTSQTKQSYSFPHASNKHHAKPLYVKQNAQREAQMSLRDNRSFKEIASSPNPTTDQAKTKTTNNHPQPTLNQATLNNSQPKPITSIPKPSKFRIMNSRALGEDTENIRKSLKEIEIDSDIAAALKGSKCEENVEMLQRSAIAIAASSQTSESLLNTILSEGVNCLTIKPMGGMQHLLIFETFEDKKRMMESKWLMQWFMVITNVNDQSATLWRETWVTIYGVPLIAWGYENFYNIGCVLGRVISVDYKGFEYAQVLIYTDCLFDISCKLSMEIDGKNYEVFVSEKKMQWHGVHQDGRSKPSYNTQQNPKATSPGTPTSNEKSPPHDDTNKNHPVSNGKNQPDEQSLLGENVSFPYELPPHVTFPTTPIMSGGFNDAIPNVSPWYPNHLMSERSNPNPSSPHPIQPPFTITSENTCQKNPPKRPTHISPINNYNTTNIQINLSPSKQNTSSPIPLKNNFGPLMRHKRPNSSSTSTGDSSISSGPLFPPGFEDRIPIQFKVAQIQKRKKKLQKKRKLKHMAKCKKCEPLTTSPTESNTNSIQSDDIIAMAKVLGLSYNGTMSELRERIEQILESQKQNWATNNA